MDVGETVQQRIVKLGLYEKAYSVKYNELDYELALELEGTIWQNVIDAVESVSHLDRNSFTKKWY